MSTEEKVALAGEVQGSHAVTSVLAALELPRSTWYYRQNHGVSYTEKHAQLKEPLETIAREHPEYGYRRTMVELTQGHGYHVNHKVVQRLHQEWGLPLIRSTRPPRHSGIRQAISAARERVNLVAGKEAIQPFEVAYTDFTELVYADGQQKSHLISIIDHASKLALGWAVGQRAVTGLALKAWERAKQTLETQGVDLKGLIVHHDQDPVFTSYRWTSHLLLRDQVRVSYALNGARDNPQMESFIGRFKTENRSLLLDAQTLEELRVAVGERMDYYNTRRRHSSIGYQAPILYIASLQPWS